DFESVQAFPAFRGHGPHANMEYTLQAGRDFFAINYGMGGIGALIWANRIEVGPMQKCVTCKYEEFFLSSWPNGDPAQIVDVPSNVWQNTDKDTQKPGPTDLKPTKVLYPDDPSNVNHSYLGDHTKFRILHGGTNITHVHHQHAHQWLHSPNSDDSHYRDSQMISPGAAYTLDYVYRGSGNKNQTPGDSIFHCHFYPHFAQGMWALWRVHDTFEAGTELDENGIPVAGPNVWNRALPDGEIAEGTPTPAVVPLPTYPMAPMPGRVRVVAATSPADNTKEVGFKIEFNQTDLNNGKNPGYPFFIPGVAGQRITHPPLDFAVDNSGVVLNGGLPRHLIVDGDGLYEKHNRWDFTKEYKELVAFEVPEGGTPAEQVAMQRHADRKFASFLPENGNPSPDDFLFNGQPPIGGAPWADPGIRLDGCPVADNDPTAVNDDGTLCTDAPGPFDENVRHYKVVDFQLDVVLNKKGWHYPQQRISALWADLPATRSNTRKPQPLFFRANSGEVVEYWLANLVPAYYELDDFQVRTPTDVLGQHIHLVKFDVLASDGAANGYNYEDGTLAAEEVRGLVTHINLGGGLYPDASGGTPVTLATKCIPALGPDPNAPFGDPCTPGQAGEWMGAQATVQRWYVDPLLNNDGEDRTIRTVFTHDHFGPSTHQQAGLSAGLVVVPNDSDWRDPETGIMMGGKNHPQGNRPAGQIVDGGPTSWVADIITDPTSESYREFMLEFQDRALLYMATSQTAVVSYEEYAEETIGDTPPDAVRQKIGGWVCADETRLSCTASAPNFAIGAPTDSSVTRPSPQLVTNTFGVGGYSLNYRNEPIDLRLFDPPGGTTPPDSTDLSYIYASIPRADPAQNCQPTGSINQTPVCTGSAGGPHDFQFPPPFIDAGPQDPYTPLLRAYPGDDVQIRVLVGAHMSAHSMTLHGLRWLFEPSLANSGYRSTQGMGISEHYEMVFKVPYTNPDLEVADYAYVPSSSGIGQTFGNWGILRSYQSNKTGDAPGAGLLPTLPQNPNPWDHSPQVCPGDVDRTYNVVAVQAKEVIGSALEYNARGRPGTLEQKIVAEIALIYVQEDDLIVGAGGLETGTLTLKPGRKTEPLILRAAAGECIQVNLTNRVLRLDQDDMENPWPSCDDLPSANSLINAKVRVVSPNPIKLRTSCRVGLHAQLVSFDVTESNGVNVGLNPDITVAVGETKSVIWYAGTSVPDGNGGTMHTPVEFGSASLSPSAPRMQHEFGLIGALIIEPEGSAWCEDDNSRAQARVYANPGSGFSCEYPGPGPASFREFVAIVQDDVRALSLTPGEQQPPNMAPWTRAVNYRTEPLAYRFVDA
ncbi:MAG: hypothetical protein O6922_05710, partial [Chloroflexi bacterium]|nr:hypothetical protein [Chloroflexota bacterium]